MASQKQIEANRRNARKSTGPKSVEGKERARLNAVKHGLTAESVVLPGEDATVLEARVEAWKGDFRPGGAMQDYLIERAAHSAWQLDRADRTIAARLTQQMHRQAVERGFREREEVAELGRRLFWVNDIPISLYPGAITCLYSGQVSQHRRMEEEDNPARIVNQLESTEAGCRWLLERWGELRKILDDGQKWFGPERLRAVRLLGHQPLDALDDGNVLNVYLGCRAMAPNGKETLAALLHLPHNHIPKRK